MSDAQVNTGPAAAGQPQQITIKYGVYTEKMPAGTTVAAARERISKITSMSADTAAYVNGQKVDETTPLDGNVTLNFMKRTGEKG